MKNPTRQDKVFLIEEGFMSKKNLSSELLSEVKKPKQRSPSEIVDVVSKKNSVSREIAEVALRELITKGDVLVNAEWKLLPRT